MISPPGEINRLVFFGTPTVAVPFLEALCVQGFDVGLVVTGPNKRRSRRAEPTPSPVGVAARAAGIAVSHKAADALNVAADLGVVVAFGQIIQPFVLDKLAMVNVHFSLLPRWRGAAPVERAILAGDTTTGVCLMEVAEGLDTGRVYRQVRLPIALEVTAAALTAELVDIAVAMLVEALRTGLGTPEPQQGTPTYANKINTQDRQLHWDRSAQILHRQVRVGGAWTTWRNKTFKVWQAEQISPAQMQVEIAQPLGVGQIYVDDQQVVVGTGNGWLRLIEVQVQGSSRQQVQDWLRGARLEPGEQMG